MFTEIMKKNRLIYELFFRFSDLIIWGHDEKMFEIMMKL